MIGEGVSDGEGIGPFVFRSRGPSCSMHWWGMKGKEGHEVRIELSNVSFL